MKITSCVFSEVDFEMGDNEETVLILNALTTYKNLIEKVRDSDPKTPFFNGEQKYISNPIGGTFEYDLFKCQELIDIINNKNKVLKTK